MYFKSLEKCMLCPRECGINRYKNRGICGAGSNISLSYYSIHKGEEPIISGDKGSGTIFFTYCNLKCIYCQNKKIVDGYGKEISFDRFKDIIFELVDSGVHNINFVTPTHFLAHIEYFLKKYKSKISIPIVYNTSSYDSIKSLKRLNGLIDVYLADFKYFDNNLSKMYSNCSNYKDIAIKSIDEMYRQVGRYEIKDGLIKKGLIIRILVLPGHIDDSKKIIKYIYDKYGDNIIISIMGQYYPINKTKYSNLNSKLTNDEYSDVVNYAYDIGVRNAFIQDLDSSSDDFIPNFDINIL